MIITNFNKRFLEMYIGMPKSDRNLNSYPFLLDDSVTGIVAENGIPFLNIGFYCKQPQDWLSKFYEEDLDVEKLRVLLQNEYRNQYLVNPDRVYTAIKAFDDIRRNLAGSKFNLIFNNLIKFSKRNKPNEYDGYFFNNFKKLVKKEYEFLNFDKVIFCIGSHSDYTDDLSDLYLNGSEVIKPTPEQPYNIYLDFRGRPVLHTYHPSFWEILDIYDSMVSIILDFIKK